MSDKTWERDVDYQLGIIKKAIIFMFEEGKNELLQVSQQLKQTLQKEVMLSNPMGLAAIENQKGLLVMSTVNDQLFEPLKRLNKKIAELDAHIRALKGEDDTN